MLFIFIYPIVLMLSGVLLFILAADRNGNYFFARMQGFRRCFEAAAGNASRTVNIALIEKEFINRQENTIALCD